MSRRLPAAIGLQGEGGPEVWIVGGVDRARGNGDLASIWRAEGSGSGAVVDAATTGFPGTEDAPERALVAPTVFPVGDTRAVVSGWYGPRCPAGAADGAPRFSELLDDVRCAPDGGEERAYLVNAGSGASLPNPTSAAARQSFGAAARLPDGRVVVSGGVTNAELTAGLRLVHYPADADVEGRAPPEVAEDVNLLRARAFHRSTAIGASSVLTTGGARLALGGDAPELLLVGLAEVYTLTPPEVLDAPGDDSPPRDGGVPDLGAGDQGGGLDAGR